MNTRLVNCAADVILAALTRNQTAAGIAMALESAQLLQWPETATAQEKLRASLREACDQIAALESDLGGATARVAELEAQLAAKDRTVDEDPIAFALTDKATATMPDLPRDVSQQVRKLRLLLAGQRDAAVAEVGERS